MLLTNWLMSLKHRFPRMRSRVSHRGRRLSRLSSLRRWDSPVQSCASVELLEDRTLLSVDSPVVELFNVSPALYVENQGQWENESVRYAFFGSGANVLHTDTGPVFQLFQQETSEGTDEPSDLRGPDDLLAKPEDVTVRQTQFSVSFDGAQSVEAVGLDQAEAVHNYFVGDPGTDV